MRSFLSWLLPLLVAGALAVGSVIGLSLLPDSPALQDGPAGDLGGAAGALVAVVCLVVGFIVALATRIAVKLARRDAPRHLAARLGLSVLGGAVIGALAVRPADDPVATWSSRALLLGVPFLATWSRRPRSDAEPEPPREA